MSVSQEKLSFLSTQCWWGHTLIVVSNSGPTLNLVALEDTREIWTYCKETNVGPQKWFYDCNSLFPTLSVVLGVGRYRSLEWGSEVEPEREEVRGCCYHYLLKTKIYFNWKKKKKSFSLCQACFACDGNWQVISLSLSHHLSLVFSSYLVPAPKWSLWQENERVVGLAGGRGQSTTEETQSDTESSFSIFLADVGV